MTACVDFGWWYGIDGRRRLLTWWRDGAVTFDGLGGVELLGYIQTEDLALEVFAGWADECDYPNGAGCVRERMALFAARSSA